MSAALGCGGRRVPPPDWAWEDEELGRVHVRPGEVGGSDPALPSGDRTVPPLSPEEAGRRLDAALAAGQGAQAAIFADRLRAAGGALGTRAAALADAIEAADEASLRAAWPELDAAQPPAPLVALRLGRLAAHRGAFAAAARWLEVAAADASLAAEAGAVRDALPASAEPRSIAVLLPLSGRFAALGVELRAGIEVAAGAETAPPMLHFLDTQGDADAAAAAVERAVDELHAVAILGPVGAAESRAAAARAAELGVPIALLAPGDGGASPAAGVFRVWSSPEWEAREAARLAVELGYDRLAVLVPRDEQGAAAAAAFRATAVALGAEVTVAGDYDPTATDLEPDMKAFLGLDPRTNARLRAHLRRAGKRGWQTFSPDVPFALLYIPDDHDRAALVASFLPYFNVELRADDLTDIVALRKKHGGHTPQVVQLLGSSGWHHPGIVPRGGSAVEGALIVDVWSGGDAEVSASDGAAAFATAFHDATGRAATAVAAQAFDAASLLFAARAEAFAGAAPADGRAAVAVALHHAHLDDGACGEAAIDERGATAGELRRAAFLLRIEGGEIVVHSP